MCSRRGAERKESYYTRFVCRKNTQNSVKERMPVLHLQSVADITPQQIR